jgi:asparagine synthase (glutamine-hydrolysing)
VNASAKDFVNAVREVIYAIESYDTTTVRASVGNYLVAKYIRENTDVKVVFNGDGSDEVCMGYLYNLNAPSDEEFFQENLKLLKEIYIYDVLRSDRSVASHGLEARTPFLDKDFVDYYMTIPIEMKRFGGGVPEKNLLRRAFDESALLPPEILNRTKCAFSDAVSTRENSWHKIVQQHVDSQITDDEFEKNRSRIIPCTPVLKESYYYRKVFEEFFGKSAAKLIPHFWMPNWSDVQDPSARELSTYQEDDAAED